MTAIRVMLWIGVGLGALLVLVVLTLLLCRTWIRYRGYNQNHNLQVGIGILRVQLLPRRRRTAARKTSAPDKPRESASAPRDLGAITYRVLDLLDSLRDTLRVGVLRLELRVGSPDAAQTGMLLGAYGAMAGMIYPYLEQNFIIKDCRVAIDADFEATRTKWSAEVECSMRLFRLLGMGLRERRKLRELMDLFHNDEEENA